MPEEPEKERDTVSKSGEFSIQWDGRRFRISLPYQGHTIEVEATPKILSVVRYREIGDKEWSLGFVTPLNGCELIGAESGAKHEIQVTHMDVDTRQESEPVTRGPLEAL